MKKRKQRNNVIPQMFDVRPVDESGGFDVEKYSRLPKEIKIKEKKKIARKELISLRDINFKKPGQVKDDFPEKRKNSFATTKRQEPTSAKITIDRESLESRQSLTEKNKQSFEEQYRKINKEKEIKERAARLSNRIKEINRLSLNQKFGEDELRDFVSIKEDPRERILSKQTFFYPHIEEGMRLKEKRRNWKDPRQQRRVNLDKEKEEQDYWKKIVEERKQEKLRKEKEKEKRKAFRLKQEQKQLEKQEKIRLKKEREEQRRRGELIKEEERKKREEQKRQALILREKEKEREKLRKRQERENRRIKGEKTARKTKEFLLNIFRAKPSRFKFASAALSFTLIVCLTSFSVFASRFAFYGFQIKEDVEVKGNKSIDLVSKAKANFEDKNIPGAIENLEQAREEIKQANQDLEKIGGEAVGLFSGVPFLSKASSGKNLLEAGDSLLEAVSCASDIVKELERLENPLASSGDKSVGDVFMNMNKKLSEAEDHVKEAQVNMERVKTEDVPEKHRDKIEKIKQLLPQLKAILGEIDKNQFVFKDMLGYNGPRKYLFLFQNNQEMRATGGFIGSYGVLKIHEGHVKDLFIEGIYDPDGQLDVNVVPPKPIQKISAAWSTHDANWFPDFPASADKISWFYEKTGGPTIDGIITLTPEVIKNLLEVTGPIDMPEYETSISAENFMEKIQYEVEFDYDKRENKPKKIIADMTPKLMEKVFNQKSLKNTSQVMKVFLGALNEKHILIHSQNEEIQKRVSELGWSGEILGTPKDYLMVVNSNINGFKTDGVIDQDIKHQAEIQPDGTIVDTVTVTRRHNGGNTGYEFWDEVNANYMRVYVPKGSELIKASGHTRETVPDPIDYEKLNFKKDSLVEKQENSTEIDKETGTRIHKEKNKTVFGNWTYVSPGEETKVTYQYKLPFKINLNKNEEETDFYSLLAQKQAGSVGVGFQSEINLPENMETYWRYPKEQSVNSRGIELKGNLNTDNFQGAVLKKKN
ncbi:MAG: DUF4012 domain-containing protein [Patescibacteria group bacterium]